MAQYKNVLGVRGDNNLERAKHLGYPEARGLYPDVESTPLETFIRDSLEGEAKTIYS